MAHELMRLSSRLYNTPHLITQSSLESILSYVESRNQGDFVYGAEVLTIGEKQKDTSLEDNYNPDTQVGFLNINGPLTYKATGWEAMCGGASYEQILSDFQELADAGAKTVVLAIDSGGGEAYAMMETANELRVIADMHDINILSYVDGTAASAAYGLATIADEIIVNPDAEVGSIGVVVRLMNDSKAMEKEGIERTFIYAGDSKVPFAADGSFRQDFLEDIQHKVDALYSNFAHHVSTYRGISEEAVRATQAKTFLPKEALEIGLADKQMTRQEFFSYLADVSEKQRKGNKDNMLGKLFNLKQQEVKADMAELKELQDLQEKFASLQANFDGKEAELAAVLEKAQAAQLEVEKLQAALDAVNKAQAEAKADTRKAQLAEVIGTAALDTTFAAMAALDDTAFATVLAGMKGARQAEAEASEFKEVGVTAEGKAEEMSAEAKILKAKYNQ